MAVADYGLEKGIASSFWLKGYQPLKG